MFPKTLQWVYAPGWSRARGHGALLCSILWTLSTRWRRIKSIESCAKPTHSYFFFKKNIDLWVRAWNIIFLNVPSSTGHSNLGHVVWKDYSYRQLAVGIQYQRSVGQLSNAFPFYVEWITDMQQWSLCTSYTLHGFTATCARGVFANPISVSTFECLLDSRGFFYHLDRPNE